MYFKCTSFVVCTSVFLKYEVSKFVRHQDLSLFRMCFGCPGCVSWMVVVGSLRSAELGMLGMLCALLLLFFVPGVDRGDLGISGPPGGMSRR